MYLSHIMIVNGMLAVILVNLTLQHKQEYPQAMVFLVVINWMIKQPVLLMSLSVETNCGRMINFVMISTTNVNVNGMVGIVVETMLIQLFVMTVNVLTQTSVLLMTLSVDSHGIKMMVFAMMTTTIVNVNGMVGIVVETMFIQLIVMTVNVLTLNSK